MSIMEQKNTKWHNRHFQSKNFLTHKAIKFVALDGAVSTFCRNSYQKWGVMHTNGDTCIANKFVGCETYSWVLLN